MTAPVAPTGHPGNSLGVVASLTELIALRTKTSATGSQPTASNARIPGQHMSHHKNRGMEFAETRPYQSGDDVRMLDWRQTARRGRPYTKLFQEEHERPVHLLVDLGPSMRFGTRSAFKSVAAARVAALLAWRAVAAGDRVGGLVCNGEVADWIRPQGRQHGALALLGQLARVSAACPADQATHLAASLQTLVRAVRPGSLSVVISDFAVLDAAVERQLLALSGSGELLLLHVYDGFEATAPPPGIYPVTDGRQRVNLDLRTPATRGAYEAIFTQRRLKLGAVARRASATLVAVPTHLPPEAVLAPTLLLRPDRCSHSLCFTP